MSKDKKSKKDKKGKKEKKSRVILYQCETCGGVAEKKDEVCAPAEVEKSELSPKEAEAPTCKEKKKNKKKDKKKDKKKKKKEKKIAKKEKKAAKAKAKADAKIVRPFHKR